MNLLKVLINYLAESRKKESRENSRLVPLTAEESNQRHNERMGKLLADNGDLIEGLEYRATLQLRTPLRILSLDGTIWKDGVLPNSEESWHGIWVPKTKTWHELGFDFDESPLTSSASHIGYVNRSEYLHFLKEIRGAVESDESIKKRIEALRLVMRQKKYAQFVCRHEGENRIIDTFFPFVLDSIPGLSKSVVLVLRESKITTIQQLRKITDKDLLALQSIGTASLKKIREFIESFSDDETIDRIDIVKR